MPIKHCLYNFNLQFHINFYILGISLLIHYEVIEFKEVTEVKAITINK